MKLDKLNIPDDSIRTIRNFGIDADITGHAHARYENDKADDDELAALIPDQ